MLPSWPSDIAVVRRTLGVTCGADRRGACAVCKRRDGPDRQVDAVVRWLAASVIFVRSAHLAESWGTPRRQVYRGTNQGPAHLARHEMRLTTATLLQMSGPSASGCRSE